MYLRLRVKYPLFLSDFNETWIFVTDLLKLLKYRIQLKILAVGGEFHVGRLTDIMKLIVAFRSFAKAPKKWLISEAYDSSI
jgi:hypothetical protein